MGTALIKPELIRWARERSGLSSVELRKKFPKLESWEDGSQTPSMRQIENLAKATHTPLGYLFLDTPPVETLPVPDYRTMSGEEVRRPGPDLIDTIHDMQRRQDWLRDYLLSLGEEPLPFVGAARGKAVVRAAEMMRSELRLDDEWPQGAKTWEDAFRDVRNAAEDAGICVAISGVVGMNTRRVLRPEEFRGFVLSDSHAPVIFVNGADSKSAQMFTLAHELAHVWTGRSGVFNLINTLSSHDKEEELCNEIAAEFLVPEKQIRKAWEGEVDGTAVFYSIAKRFKVSPIVAARRASDLKLVPRSRFFAFYRKQQEEWAEKKAMEREAKEGGADFYNNQNVRLGRRFGAAIVRAARSGQINYLDAYRLTGLRGESFDRFGDRLLEKSKDERS